MLVQPIVAPLIQMVRNTRCCFTGGSKLRSFSYSALVVSLALLGSAMPATAAAGAPSNAVKAALDQAHRAEAANRSGEAIEALKRAYELSGDTEILFRLAEMTRKAGQDVSALRFYRAYLARDPRGKHRAVAERQAQLLEIAGPQAGSAPAAGATALAPPPVGSPYTPASAAAPGGESRPWERPTNAPPAAAPKTFGSVTPSAIAGGQGSAPAIALATTPPPMTDYHSSPSVDLRADSSPAAADGVQPPLPRWLPWTGLAATLALGAGATVSGISASHHYNDLHNSCGATPTGCSSAQIDDVRSRARTTTLLWVGAGVMAAATGVSVYFNTREAGVSGIWRF